MCAGNEDMNNDNLHIDIDLLTRFLTGEATTEEQKAVHLWKDASAENLTKYNEFVSVWELLDKTSLLQGMDIDKEWEIQRRLNLKEKVDAKDEKERGRVINFTNYLKYAASITIILGLSYFGYNYFSKTTINTGITETKEISLPDGSQVTLNANSKLIYQRSFNKSDRQVSLKGEAFFNVKKDALKPFVVKAGNTEVKVLGTSFNVREFGNTKKVEVTVSEGTVSVYEMGNEQKKVIITKGEKAIYNNNLKVVSKQVNEDRNYKAWITRYIVFENDSLSVITKTLGNVYHVEFIIQDPNLNQCTVTTKFDNKNLQTILKVLKKTLDIEIIEKDRKIYLKGKGC